MTDLVVVDNVALKFLIPAFVAAILLHHLIDAQMVQSRIRSEKLAMTTLPSAGGASNDNIRSRPRHCPRTK